MNNQFIVNKNSLVILDENNELTGREYISNTQEVLALENLLEKTQKDKKQYIEELKELTDPIYILYKIGQNYFISLGLGGLIGLIITIILLLINPDLYSIIKIPIYASMITTFAVSTIISEKKRKNKIKELARKKIKAIELEEHYAIDLKTARNKGIENAVKQNISYEFNHNILDKCSYEYYDINQNQKELFKVKKK